MPTTKAQQRATTKYIAGNYDEIKLYVPKGERSLIRAHAENMGESTNAFCCRAIRETIENDKKKTPEP